MLSEKYKKACTEVLEILSHFPKEDYLKIPTEEIEILKNNMDKNYEFKIDSNKSLKKQNISKEAHSIIINLFLNYYATKEQKDKINEILKLNQKNEETKKRKKYNPDDIFLNRKNKKIC